MASTFPHTARSLHVAFRPLPFAVPAAKRRQAWRPPQALVALATRLAAAWERSPSRIARQARFLARDAVLRRQRHSWLVSLFGPQG